jgi:elongation factor Ts
VGSLQKGSSLCFCGQPSTALWSGARNVATVTKEESLKLVKQLRAETGAPIGDVRAALKEARYDIDSAYEVLRRKGAAAAAKKADREATQVGISLHPPP